MSFLGKTYNFVKQENFEGFLKSVGLPEDKVQALLNAHPSQKLVQNGDTYTNYTVGLGPAREVTFKSGVEFEDTISSDNTPVKTTYTVEGNTVTQILKNPKGTATFKREYNGDDLVVTITTDTWDGVAKTYYKA